MFYIYFNTRIVLQLVSLPLLSTLLVISLGTLVIKFKLRKPPMSDFVFKQRIRNFKSRPLIDGDEIEVKEPIVKNCRFNFAKVDYLNFSNDENIKAEVSKCISHYGVGTCGPRHFYGSTDVHYALEESLSKFLGTDEAIVYSYSFLTVTSSIACYCRAGDIVFVDDLCNDAIIMGLASSKSTNIYFAHNNPKAFLDLVVKIHRKHPKAKKMLVLEGIYSKDGSICPLKEFIGIAKTFKVRIFIDESISFGTLGKQGKGLTEYCDININEIDMIIGSLEHALYSVGGFCAGSTSVIEHQRLHSSSYVYSASLQTFSAKAALIALENISNKTLILRLVSLKVDRFLRSIEKFIIKSHPESPLKVFCAKNPRKSLCANKLNDFFIENGVYMLIEEENLKMNLFADFGKDPGDIDMLFSIIKRGVETYL